VRFLAKAGAGAAAAITFLLVAGCGTSPPATATPTGAPPVPNGSPATSATGRIGSGCGFIPHRGDGSFRSIRSQRVVRAAASNPQLSVFASAIKSAALTGHLDRMHAYTLFVPVNSAFEGLSKNEVDYLRQPANVAKVVRRQVVPHPITPAQIARGLSVTTLAGSKLALGKSGSDYRVGTATVVCGNIKAANATIYVIDEVLLPPR
jgi:fasciclin domain-containing protein